ncbi:GNAT family N-acetyltransferase [Pendulispora rubella]
MSTCFEKYVPQAGIFALRPLRIPEDMPLVHGWVTQEYAKYWGLQGKSVDEVAAAYRDIVSPEHVHAYIGLHDGKPAFLVECYHSMHDAIGRYYDALPSDRGMHVLVAPAEKRIPDFTWHVFAVIMDFLFSDQTVTRVVVEPDARNEKIHALNRRAGFEVVRTVDLPATSVQPAKKALLSFCTRQQYAAASTVRTAPMKTSISSSPGAAVAHLDPRTWAIVNRQHVRKIIGEFAHELLVTPELEGTVDGWGHYRLATDQANVEYRFRARILQLDHWHIDTESIERFVDGARTPLDSLALILELHTTLGIAPAMLPTYMEEITSTLYGAAYKYETQRLTAAELTRASFQEVETSMTEGHPSFVANNGRIGFDALDYRAYAPEAASPVSLIWIAVHESRAAFSSIDGLTYGDMIHEELGTTVLDSFHGILRGKGLNPESYLFMPVHPWQWFNKLASIFAPDIAAHRLVYLGSSEDRYFAQQSIRTFFNTTNPHKRYVKTSLSILNMGFMRGLSPYYMIGTPAINQWVHETIGKDAYLRENGFSILREVATVGYRNTYYEAAIPGDSPYKKMLAALWRESPIPPLTEGQRLMTMASLLHRDREGGSVLMELIASSGVGADTWLRSYLKAYLSPLLHCFYAYDMVFMPHGENLILVLQNNVPVRALMKDVAEEVAVMNKDAVLPEKVKRLAVSVPEELKVLSIFTDVFDCIFRYVGHVLVEHGIPEERFWKLVAECVHDYHRARPDLTEKFERYDLFAPEFTRSCLNRLQLGNNQQMIDLADPAKNLKFAGTLKNPIAAFKA